MNTPSIMYWICVFAVIMEIVFRIQNTRNSWIHEEVQPVIYSELSLSFADSQPFQSETKKSSSTKSNSQELLSNVIYLVRNSMDQTFLTVNARETHNCTYKVGGISSKLQSNGSKYWLIYLDSTHTTFQTFLWQIIKKGRTNFLQVANLENINKWTWKDKTVKLKNVIQYIPSIPPSIKSKFQPKGPILMPRGRTINTKNNIDENYYGFERPSRQRYYNEYMDDINEGIDYGDKDNSRYNNKRYQRNRKRSISFKSALELQKHLTDKVSKITRYKKQKRSIPQPCMLNKTRLEWQLVWGIARTTQEANVNENRYQIRDSQGNCVQTKGLVGDCVKSLETASNCTWNFIQVTTA